MRKNIRDRIISGLLALSVVVTVFSCGLTVSAEQALGNVTSAAVNGNELQMTVSNGSSTEDVLVLEVCQENILRVDYRPDGAEPSPDTPMIDPALRWDTSQAEIDTSGDPITIRTGEMYIEIARTPCRMTVKKADGTTLFWEPASGGVFRDGVRFVRAEATNMYGIHGFDCFHENGNLLRNAYSGAAAAGQQGNSGGPFMWSTGGYGILVDSDGGYPYTSAQDKKMEFYYGDSVTEGRRYAKSDVEYYIMLGEPKTLMAGYSKITGTSPMMPKWALGFSNFEWNINEKELNDMVDLYRAKNIPIDSYAIDYDWKEYGKDHYGEFRWNTENFPSAATDALKRTMDGKGIKLIGITKPRIVTKLQDGKETVQGQYAAANGFFYPGHREYTDYFLPVTVRSIDFYTQQQRDWWWSQSQEAFNKGIVGWWNDETDKVSSNGADYWFGNFETMGISQAMYEGQRQYTKDAVRVWQTARNYYPGTQRYGTSIWSGDVATQFYKGERVDWAAGLNEQKAAMLSTVNNGQPKWGSDGGGFNQNSGNVENPSPELYARWLQFASVTPVFRVHGTNFQQRQPWYFGTTAEEVAKAAIQQRYALMPYLYHYEREAYETGLGLVRPLIFDYPDDPMAADHCDAWMFGDWILTAPVTQRDQSCKWIYLPEGTWIDYNRGTQYTGGKYIPYSLNSTSWTDLPMFVKAGAIIPTQDVVDYVGQSRADRIYVDIFPSDQETSFAYYDDDGTSYGYEGDSYYRQTITAQKQGDSTKVGLSEKSGNYDAGLKYFYLRVHGQAAAAVTGSTGALTRYENPASLYQAAGEGWTVGTDVYGDVTIIKVPASEAAELQISGNAPSEAVPVSYEAEDGSLSGSHVSQKASVNNNHTGYSGEGFVDGLEADESAVTFYTKVAGAGRYDAVIRYANGDPEEKTLSVYVNGAYEGQLQMPATGSWDVWSDVHCDLELAAGQNIITLKCDTDANDTGRVNVDYLRLPHMPDVILTEAEESALYGEAKCNQDHWMYSGSGFVDTLRSAGDGVAFPVFMKQAGQHPISLRYANGTNSAKTLNMYVNGQFVSTAELPSNGQNWNLWQEYETNVDLAEGMNMITFQYDAGNSGNVNLDRLAVNLFGTGEAPLLDNGDFERSDKYNSAWTQWHPEGQSSAYGVDSGSGTNPPESPAEGDKRAYFYASGPYQQSIHQAVAPADGMYRLEFWARCFNTEPKIARAEIRESDGTVRYENLQYGSGWKHYVIDHLSLSQNGDIGFYVDSPGGTTFQLDGVELKRAG